jgi:hypothetical protein
MATSSSLSARESDGWADARLSARALPESMESLFMLQPALVGEDDIPFLDRRESTFFKRAHWSLAP